MYTAQLIGSSGYINCRSYSRRGSLFRSYILGAWWKQFFLFHSCHRKNLIALYTYNLDSGVELRFLYKTSHWIVFERGFDIRFMDGEGYKPSIRLRWWDSAHRTIKKSENCRTITRRTALQISYITQADSVRQSWEVPRDLPPQITPSHSFPGSKLDRVPPLRAYLTLSAAS